MKRGKLIVFEGISGTGKETQAKLLQTYLNRKKFHCQIIYHPSIQLKEILKIWRKERDINAQTEVYLLLADRHSMVRQTINPALKRGIWVISLRSFISALVYQGRTIFERKWIEKEFSRFEPKADFLFYFDIVPQVAQQRILFRHRQTGEALGKFETLPKLKQKQKAYKEVLKNKSYIPIDVSGSITSVHKQIIEHLNI